MNVQYTYTQFNILVFVTLTPYNTDRGPGTIMDTILYIHAERINKLYVTYYKQFLVIDMVV